MVTHWVSNLDKSIFAFLFAVAKFKLVSKTSPAKFGGLKKINSQFALTCQRLSQFERNGLQIIDVAGDI